jgi:thimet oligopeptidase
MLRSLFSILVFCSLLAAAQEAKISPPLWSTKPDIAAFDKTEQAHMDAAQAAIDRIVASQSGLRTVANTLGAYDEAVTQINSALYFSGLMEAVHPDAAFRDHAQEMTRKVSAMQTALALNQPVYQALSAIDTSKADDVTRYYLKRQLLLFRLAGVDRDDATRAQIKKLNDQLTDEQSNFERNIAEGQKTVAADPSELEGLPQDYIDRHKVGADGKVHLTTDYPDYYPVMTFAKSEALRRRLLEAFETRAYPKNIDVLKNLMQTRYQIATLLGYSSWADYYAADKMIGKGSNIGDFIRQLDTAARPTADRELAMLISEKQRVDPQAKEISDYESGYFSELVRRSRYDFDSQSVRPYLPYDRVRQGILDTAATLFHVSFEQEKGVPAWDPSVETWLVTDHGKTVGRFYLDMHPRAGKFSHAEMLAVLDGIRGKQLPEAALICNFPAPTATDPGLMSYGDVVTFFHEFGHLMHWILGGHQPWAGISGITMEADFGEAPSQMLEEWMRSPQVLASFAKNYQTGEPIPAELVERMNRASAFGRALSVSAQNSYTAISYDLYKGKPADTDIDQVCRGDNQNYSHIMVSPESHMCAAFGHLAGYSSAYYTYMWDKVIAEDFFTQFDQNNLLAGEAPMRYRRVVLEPGGSMSANDLVKNFLGRPQNMAAFEQWMGEEFRAGGDSARSAGQQSH